MAAGDTAGEQVSASALPVPPTPRELCSPIPPAPARRTTGPVPEHRCALAIASGLRKRARPGRYTHRSHRRGKSEIAALGTRGRWLQLVPSCPFCFLLGQCRTNPFNFISSNQSSQERTHIGQSDDVVHIHVFQCASWHLGEPGFIWVLYHRQPAELLDPP